MAGAFYCANTLYGSVNPPAGCCCWCVRNVSVPAGWWSIRSKNRERHLHKGRNHQSSKPCAERKESSSIFNNQTTVGVQLTLPGEICSVQLLQVAGRGGVEHIDFAAVGLQSVDVADKLVQILVPQVGILILEVWPHGHYDVIGLIHQWLMEGKTVVLWIILKLLKITQNHQLPLFNNMATRWRCWATL